MGVMKCHVALCLVLLLSPSAWAQTLESDRTALIALSTALVPRSFAGVERPGWWGTRALWKATGRPPLCGGPGARPWKGVTCVEGRVTELNLNLSATTDGLPPRIRLEGTIPWDQLSSLDKLAILDLSGQNVTGDAFANVPSTLTSLKVLNLGGNNLMAFSEGVSALSALTHLNLAKNPMLTGAVPSGLTALTSLVILNLQGTNMAQPWPTALGSLPALASLNLGSAGFTGALPDGWSTLTSLSELNVANSSAGGGYPTAWSTLTKLVNLDASSCQLQSSFPNFVGVAGLVKLDLSNNKLFGNVSATLFQPGAAIDISDNLLTGTLPSPLPDAALVNISNNCFTGAPNQLLNTTCQAFYANTTNTTPPPSSGGTNTALIIGLSVAGGVLLLVLIGLLVWFFMARKSGDDDDDEEYDDDEDGDNRRDDDDDDEDEDDDDDDKRR